MKHKRLTALVLAAALVLAGCGGTKSSSGSAAASQSTGSSQNAPAIAVQKERITEQFTLEKTVRNEWGSAQKLTIHVPQLVCDSPDAEYINNELAAMYAAEYRDYESYPQAEVSQDEWCPQTYIDWDAYWYGDCVSLVVSSYYGGTDPIYSQGWCFDFAAGHKLSVTELLMRMGLDPDETQLAVYRAAIQTFDRNMVQQEYYDSLRESGMLSGMRADTLRDNGLENLTVLLKNENTVTLVAGYHTTAGSFSLGEGENWCWLDLNSGGGCQLATHNNRYFYQGAVTYLGATPDGTALGFSLVRDTENGPEWVAFSAALKLDYSIDCLILTPLSGQNPLTNETVPLVLTHSYG